MWGGFGIGLVAMLMHSGPNHEFEFHAVLAVTQLWIVAWWVRIAVGIPRCRVFASYFGVSLLASATATFYNGITIANIPFGISNWIVLIVGHFKIFYSMSLSMIMNITVIVLKNVYM